MRVPLTLLYDSRQVFLPLGLSFLICLMGASILIYLGVGKLESSAEKELLHSGSGIKIQSLLQEPGLYVWYWSRGRARGVVG